MKLNYNYFAFFILLFLNSFSQVGVGTTAPTGALDITSTTNGIVIPRVALTSKIVSAPVVNPQGGALVSGTLVWNTATAGASPNNVLPGFYYWSGTAWIGFTGANSNDWSISGNSGTTTSNYVGTSDAVDLKLSTSGAEKMRVLSNGQVVINNTGVPIAGDRFSSYATGADFAVNGYSTLTGTGIYGQNTGTGYGVYGSAVNFGTVGVSTGSIGVFGQGNAAAGSGVYGTSSGANGTGVFGYSTGTTSDGVYGQSTVALGNGVWGVGNNATGSGVLGSSTGSAGIGVFGSATGANGAGVYGTSSKAAGTGVFGVNTQASGTAIVGVGNNLTGTYLTAGSGGAFKGSTTGAAAWGSAAANGVGFAAAGNNNTITTIGTVGAGGSFIGNQWGTTSIANITGAGNNGTDRAAYIGNYISAGNTQETVYVGARIGGTHYKILGTNAGSVSTTMKTSQGERILFAPEAPENWFFDIGEATLVNGRAEVRLDPVFAECISDSKPFKVFVQGGENTLGSIRVTRNQADKSFILEDLGGASNGTVQYNIYAIWKTKENLRFPELKESDKPKQVQAETVQAESKPERRPESEKKTKAGGDISSAIRDANR